MCVIHVPSTPTTRPKMVWSSTGNPRSPLACVWVMAPSEAKSKETFSAGVKQTQASNPKISLRKVDRAAIPPAYAVAAFAVCPGRP